MQRQPLARHRPTCLPQPRKRPQQGRKGELDLQAGQRGAQAVVHAAAERQGRFARTVQAQCVRFGEDLGITVGRAQQQDDALSGGQRVTTAVKFLRRSPATRRAVKAPDTSLRSRV